MKKLNSSKLFTKGIFRENIALGGASHIVEEVDSKYLPLKRIYLKDSNNLFLKSSDGLILVVRGG